MYVYIKKLSCISCLLLLYFISIAGHKILCLHLFAVLLVWCYFVYGVMFRKSVFRRFLVHESFELGISNARTRRKQVFILSYLNFLK